ncbi:hypothetical protein HIM_11778 [Hirsutella minnesotensis 3608]|uniref:Uncharacterized protein n=1 Tax=Hirsutella minnesotensis 3608 TaxID=1043627 RepID=A0A0F8A0T2_9HYPO|nr:hypothetical protein HIM_11778 [Hirsutella minnesotensis 3608]
MPSEMLQELEKGLIGGRNFHFCGALTGAGLYEIVLRIGSEDGPTSLSALLPVPGTSRFDSQRSRAWNLRCCHNSLACDVKAWSRVLYPGEDKVTFGNMKLIDELVKETGDLFKQMAEDERQKKASVPGMT